MVKESEFMEYFYSYVTWHMCITHFLSKLQVLAHYLHAILCDSLYEIAILLALSTYI